jgi:hypothetical protein
MRMPDASITVNDISTIMGPSFPVEVIDVASQTGLSSWTMGQWATYYNDTAEKKVRNVISLEISNSPLSDQVVPPLLCRKLDWVSFFTTASACISLHQPTSAISHVMREI